MIDFSKIGTGNTFDTLLHPREIFNALPNKDAVKFQYPRDVQTQVWDKWYRNRTEENIVIKMNTGSGKTVVGLLLLKSCLNEKKSPAVYLCPDNYLVQQAIDAANELGVEVTNDVESHRFISGKAILVTNIYKLVNGKSVFGVGDEGAKINISSLVIDDAHACLDTIEDQFTINIPSGTDAYDELYELFKNALHYQCEAKAIEIENGDITITTPEILSGGKFDLSNSPDLLPPLAILALKTSKPIEIVNVKHARLKETDRIAIVSRELAKLGLEVEEREDGMILHPSITRPFVFLCK